MSIGTIVITALILGAIAYYVSGRNGQNSKSSSIAYLLWFIGAFGILGFHRFYLGKIGTGIIWLFTGGVFGVGALIDLFTLGGKVSQYNTNEELKTIRATTNSNAQHIANNLAQQQGKI